MVLMTSPDRLYMKIGTRMAPSQALELWYSSQAWDLIDVLFQAFHIPYEL